MASMSKSSAPKAPPPRPSANAAAPTSPHAKESKDHKGAKKKEDDDDDDAGVETAEKGPEKDDAGAAEAAQLKAEVDPIIKSGAVVKALETAIKATGTSKDLIAMQTTLALQAMDGVKADDIGKILDAAEDNHIDTLTRIVYAGMATGKNCPSLLVWHGKIVDKVGIGAIMRAMCCTH